MTGDLALAATSLARLNGLVAAERDTFWKSWAACLEGTLLIRRGEPATGSARLRDGLESFSSVGSMRRTPDFLGTLAEGLGRPRAGRCGDRHAGDGPGAVRPRRPAVERPGASPPQRRAAAGDSRGGRCRSLLPPGDRAGPTAGCPDLGAARRPQPRPVAHPAGAARGGAAAPRAGVRRASPRASTRRTCARHGPRSRPARPSPGPDPRARGWPFRAKDGRRAQDPGSPGWDTSGAPLHRPPPRPDTRSEPWAPSPPRTAPRSTTRTGAPASRSSSATAGRSAPTRSKTRCSSWPRAATAASPTTAAATGGRASPGSGNDLDTYADDLAALVEALDLQGRDPRRPLDRRRRGHPLHRPARHRARRQGRADRRDPAADAQDRRPTRPARRSRRSTSCAPPSSGRPLAVLEGPQPAVLRLQPARREDLGRRARVVLAAEHDGRLPGVLLLHQGVLRDRPHRGPEAVRRADADPARRRRPDRADRRRRRCCRPRSSRARS